MYDDEFGMYKSDNHLTIELVGFSTISPISVVYGSTNFRTDCFQNVSLCHYSSYEIVVIFNPFGGERSGIWVLSTMV